MITSLEYFHILGNNPNNWDVYDANSSLTNTDHNIAGACYGTVSTDPK